MAEDTGEGQKVPAENAAITPKEGGEDKTGEAKGEGEKGKTGETSKEEPPEDPEKHQVPVRKSAASFIIERKNRKIEKLAAKSSTAPTEELDEEGNPIPKEDEEEDEITPQARQAIREEIAPIVEHFSKDADERSRNSEINEYLSKNSGHAKYEPLVRKYAGIKEYQGVPAEVIFHHLAFRDAEAQGAKKAQLAADEAKRKNAGADSRKATDSDQPDFKSMSAQEFRDWQRKNLGY